MSLPLRSTSLPENTGAATPDAFGPFRVLHQTGSGTLGPVFRAYDPDQDRLVAVKLFTLDLEPSQGQALVARLQELVDLDLAHPAIAAPVATGLADGFAYLAQDFAAADSLEVVLREFGAASPGDAARVASQVAGALDAAAAQGVYHGALHPRDLLVTADDARVTGFGVAQALEVIGVAPPVRSPYAAPERVSRAPWDRRADVYSLAVLVAEILTGRPPGDQDALGDVLGAGTELSAFREVLAKAMAEQPEDRYDTSSAFAEAFSALADQAAVSSGSSSTRRSPASRRVEAKPVEPLLPLADPPPVTETLLPGDRPASAPETDTWDASLTRASSEETTKDALTDTLEEIDADLTLATEPPTEAIHRSGLDWDLAEANRLTVADLDADTHGDDAVRVGRAVDETRISAANAPLDFPTRASASAPVTDVPLDVVPAVLPPPTSSSPVWPIPLAWMVGIIMGIAVGFFIFGNRTGEQEAATPPSTPSTVASAAPAASPPVGRTVVVDPPSAAGVASTTGVSPPSPASAPPAPALPAPGPDAADPPTPPRSESPGAERGRPRPASPAPIATSGSRRAAGGRLLVRSSPTGARVLLDGKEVGTTPTTLRALAQGSHALRLSRAGYETEERRITITSSQPSQSIVIDLAPARDRGEPRSVQGVTPRAPAGVPAALIVESRPPGAVIYVDGRRVGTTPATIDNVRVGQHTIFLELEGFRGWTRLVELAGGENHRVSASLEQ